YCRGKNGESSPHRDRILNAYWQIATTQKLKFCLYLAKKWAVKALDFSGCNSCPGTGSLHPAWIDNWRPLAIQAVDALASSFTAALAGKVCCLDMCNVKPAYGSPAFEHGM